jgi:hypothetical protein
MALILPLTACSTLVTTQSTSSTNMVPPESKTRLAAADLVQRLAAAISYNADIGATYNSIPEKQRSNLTQDEFQQYIQMLRRGFTSNIHSFAEMGANELKTVQMTMAQNLPDQIPLIQSSQGYWLYFRETSASDNKMAIFIQQDSDQNVYLSADWIHQVLNIDRFALLYFDAVDKQDVAALTVLLEQTIPNHVEATGIAAKLIEFYKNQIGTTSADFQLTQVRIDEMVIAEYNIFYPGQTSQTNREVSLQVQPDASIMVRDILPENLTTKDTQVRQGDKVILALGSGPDYAPYTLYGPQIEQTIGKPVLHDDTNCKLLANGKRQIDLQYDGLDLTILGECPDHIHWTGRIQSLKLHDDRYNLASGIYVGMPVNDLFSRCPFIGRTNYQITTTLPSGTFNLTISVGAEKVSQIQLSLVS